MAKRDYYEILGVSKNATDEEIKKAYRVLAKRFHPDVSKEPNATEKFKEVQEAYETLSNPQSREQYNQFGHEGPNLGGAGFGGFSGGGFGGFEDIISQMFGGGRRRPSGPTSQQGADLRTSINITFEEAAFGIEKEITVTKNDTCSTCSGLGAESKKDVETCSTCRGTGRVVNTQSTILGTFQTESACSTCGGKGKVIKNKCKTCNGAGRIKKTSNVKVRIPSGIEDGQGMKLAGYGEAGVNGGGYGDLFVYINVKPHEIFQRDGLNIHLDMPITFSQAALGDTIQVPTLTGSVSLKVPSGTQTGTKFRLQGKGITNARTNQAGSQFVTVNLVTPTKLSNDQKELFTKLSKTNETSERVFDKIRKFFKM